MYVLAVRQERGDKLSKIRVLAVRNTVQYQRKIYRPVIQDAV
jgi:hypothetical protein